MLWEAITTDQIHNEFDAYYDWMHHGEVYLFFYFFGLADPHVLKDRQRAARFAGLYTGDDSEALNYDKEKKLMRSPITRSRESHFQQTAEDWETLWEILDDYRKQRRFTYGRFELFKLSLFPNRNAVGFAKTSEWQVADAEPAL